MNDDQARAAALEVLNAKGDAERDKAHNKWADELARKVIELLDWQAEQREFQK